MVLVWFWEACPFPAARAGADRARLAIIAVTKIPYLVFMFSYPLLQDSDSLITWSTFRAGKRSQEKKVMSAAPDGAGCTNGSIGPCYSELEQRRASNIRAGATG
jgi:hypothetical protein